MLLRSRVRLTELYIENGSSGSWVFKGDHIIGFVIAIHTRLPWIYVVSIEAAFEKIKSKTEMSIRVALQEDIRSYVLDRMPALHTGTTDCNDLCSDIDSLESSCTSEEADGPHYLAEPSQTSPFPDKILKSDCSLEANSIPASFRDLASQFHRRFNLMRVSLQPLQSYYNTEYGAQILQGVINVENLINEIRAFNDVQDPVERPISPNPPLPSIPLDSNPLPGARTSYPINAAMIEIGEPNAQDESDMLRKDLEEARREVFALKATLADVRRELALKSTQTRDFDMAHKQYQALSEMKAEEKTELLRNNQRNSAKAAELNELTYRYESAKQLVELGRYSEALRELAYVRQRRMILLNNHDIRFKSTPEVQLDLCNPVYL